MERQLTGLYLTFIGSGTRMTSSDSTIRDASPTTGSIPRSASASPADLAICWIGAFAVAATLYIATMAPGVLWGDSGDAQARLLNRLWRDPRDLARAHVSYYAVGWLVQVVTGRTAAWSANLVAALAGAATVAHVAVATRLLTVNRLAAGAAALLMMLSHTLWQLSCGAEVVTFSTMCLAGEMALLILLIRTQRLEFAVTLALVNGIGWTTHNLAMLTWPVYALLIIQHRRTVFGCGPRAIAVVAAAWLAGCAPLLVMTVSACLEASSVGETLRSLLVGRYAPQVFHHEVTSGGLLRVGGYVLMNFPTPLLILAPWGWWALRAWSRAVWIFVTLAGLAYFRVRGPIPCRRSIHLHGPCLFVPGDLHCNRGRSSPGLEAIAGPRHGCGVGLLARTGGVYSGARVGRSRAGAGGTIAPARAPVSRRRDLVLASLADERRRRGAFRP
jgi:hypothetical protein